MVVDLTLLVLIACLAFALVVGVASWALSAALRASRRLSVPQHRARRRRTAAIVATGRTRRAARRPPAAPFDQDRVTA